jgi:outer membrane protein assembly factor BamB
MRTVLVSSALALLPWTLSCAESPAKRSAASTTASTAARTTRASQPAKTPPGGVHDWFQWRGPQRDGKSTETGLLDEWPKEGPKLLWTAKDVNKGKSVGAGYASLAIAAGRIYTMGDRDGGEHVVCLDLATGKMLWSTKIAPQYGDGGARCTPTVDGDRVYGLSPHGILSCVDAGKGGVVWQKDLKKDFGGRMMSGWNYSESPLVDGDKLVCTPGGKEAVMVALNKASGEVIWKCAAPQDSGAGYASIVTAEVGGIKQYVTLLGSELGLIGVQADTGKLLWNYERVANGTANIPTALVHDDYVFASTAYGAGAVLLQLAPDGNGGIRASEKYFLRGNKLQNHHGGMVMLGDYVYGGHGHGDGQPFCLEWKTGTLKWGPERGAGDGSAAVVYADGHLYYRWQNNVVGLVEATPEGYYLKSDFQLPRGTSSPGWQHPVIHDGKLYIRGNDQVLCYDIRRS